MMPRARAHPPNHRERERERERARENTYVCSTPWTRMDATHLDTSVFVAFVDLARKIRSGIALEKSKCVRGK